MSEIWRQVEAVLRAPRPPRSLTKLEIKWEAETRSHETAGDQWQFLKNWLAANPAAQEEWDLAIEIDFHDPMTWVVAAVLEYDTAGMVAFFRAAKMRAIERRLTLAHHI